MKEIELLSHFLPEGLLDYFDIVEVNNTQDQYKL